MIPGQFQIKVTQNRTDSVRPTGSRNATFCTIMDVVRNRRAGEDTITGRQHGGAHLPPKDNTPGRGARVGMGVLGGCGVATAIVFALIGVFGSHNATIPQAAGTAPEEEHTEPVVRKTKPSQAARADGTALQSPAAEGPAMPQVWSGDYKLRMGFNFELDKGTEPVKSEGGANEIWVDNFGDAGYVAFTEGTLAPWDVVGRQPTPQQCLRALQAAGTNQLDVTIGDAGRGVCVQSTQGERYAYLSFTTVNQAAISGTLTVWSKDPS
jgi:hypothetical protein